MRFKSFKRAVASACAVTMSLFLVSSPALSEPTEVIFSIFIPQQAPLAKAGLIPWAQAVEEASNGTVKITIPTSSLSPQARQFDMVQDGLADIAIAPMVLREEQFALYGVAGLPGLTPTAKNASTALWQAHEAAFAAATDWDNMVPLALFTLGKGQFMSNVHPVLTPADLENYKVIGSSDERIRTWQNLGAKPVYGGGSKYFELLSSGVGEGLSTPLMTGAVLGLLDATKHITLFPGGVDRTPKVLLMNRDRFDDLPEEAQKAFRANSGLGISVKLGAIMDKIDGVGLKRFQDKGIEIHEATPELIEALTEASAFRTQEWLDAAKAAGLDGQVLLNTFIETAAGSQ